MILTLYIDTGTKRFVSHPHLSQSPYLEMLRGGIYTVHVIFLAGGAQIELGGSPEGAMVLKSEADGEAIVLATPWLKSGEGSTTIYTFQVPMNSVELGALLLTEDVIPYVDLLGAVQYGSDQTFPTAFRVYDALFNGDEVFPTPVQDDMPALNLSTLIGGGSTALDGQSISTYSVGQLMWVRRGDGITSQVDMFSLESGDYAENTNPLMGPVIVNVDTNPDEFSWIQKA